jgi:superfamily II DNA/RNA helicase
MHFRDFPFDEALQEGIASFGFEEPTKIQQASIPLILEGRDVIGCAQTGTGKTWAYALPVIQTLLAQSERELHPSVLILAPTRELAQQIDTQFEGLTYFMDISSIAIYGGGDAMGFEQQKQAIVKGADIIIATPGRLLAHIKLGYTKLEKIRRVILDEADRMLDMGFKDDIMRILQELPEQRQTLLFSATMSSDIRRFAKKIMNTPEEINFEVSKPAEGVQQAVRFLHERDKFDVLKTLLQEEQLDRVLVFSSTKKGAKQLERDLRGQGLPVQAIHSDLPQSDRNEILRKFKIGEVPVLVATDVISRGIDIDNIDMVVNYNVPQDPEDYVHRVGRTARAKKKGRAVTLVTPDEHYKLKKIERLIGYAIPRMEGSLEETVMARSGDRGWHRHNRPQGRRPAGRRGDRKGKNRPSGKNKTS